MSIRVQKGFMTLNLVLRAFPWEKPWEQGCTALVLMKPKVGVPCNRFQG